MSRTPSFASGRAVYASILLALIYVAFISLGLPDGVLGVAWPSMRAGLWQPVQAAGWVTTVVTGCSALSGFASGWVLRRWHAGTVVAASGFLTGLALLGFGFAPTFAVLLALAVPLGLGAGSVDAAMNHFVARHYASRHMNWLHGSWGLGAMLGPVIMGAALAATPTAIAPAGGAGVDAWRQGYLHIGMLQLMLAGVLVCSLRLWALAPENAQPLAVNPQDAHQTRSPGQEKLAQWLAPALFFLYAGIEVSTSLWVATVLIEQRHLPVAAAGLWVSCFFGSIMGGRFATGLVSAWLGNRRMVRYGLLLAVAGAVLFSADAPQQGWSLAGLVMLGLGCAPIYPSLMHEAARRFEPAVAQRVIGHQVGAAYVGCMLLPALLGWLGATGGLQLVMPCVAGLAALTVWLSGMLDRLT
jgi:fucose permease